MKNSILLFAASVFINLLNAQINPQQKIVTNNNVAANQSIRFTDSITGGPIRFGVGMSGDFMVNKNYSFSQRYNTNTFVTSIASDGITIKKSGLYHFEGFVSAGAFDEHDKTNGLANPQFTASLKVGEINYAIGQKEKMTGSEHFARGQLDFTHFTLSKSFSMDIYIVAPATIRFSRSFTSSINNESQFYSDGWLTGYYISQ